MADGIGAQSWTHTESDNNHATHAIAKVVMDTGAAVEWENIAGLTNGLERADIMQIAMHDAGHWYEVTAQEDSLEPDESAV
ncbi:hypothetical protein PF005_g13220 [Phytophthora fragariae]|uniref:Uncharacterized protein n=1 Tax=Phytophthora fragariae TaxID=53985 RepID=A0A6A3E961_9STRA|nr:hypothetical protein PF003_g6368 [Phytophthora fragariae]KAE8928806.1 hypothetical protein PF009_g21061 [Phytophthora fragariae]KAE9132547.1 hypothetical protein PF006_g15261 [Phytophthora fragariae]KAE9203278.1 hypothetical protein PF002_g20979 [Phytophthora fragariae]KAE9205902.1 hypothetical protein PF005_g13220 [Phytophthora fragariae]